MKKKILIPIKKKLTDTELISNIRNVAKELNKNSLTQQDYNSNKSAISNSKLFKERFGSWNKALDLAKLEVKKEMNISELQLFKNLESLIVKIGSNNIRKEDLVRPNSRYSISAYRSTFGSWDNAKIQFNNYMNKLKSKIEIDYTLRRNHTTNKKISKALENEVKRKYKYRCSVKGCKCGEAIGDLDKKYQKTIHVVHKKLWEKGGETILENLITKCEDHYKEYLAKNSNQSSKVDSKRTRSISAKIKEAVLLRDKHRCVHCGKGPYEKGKMYIKEIAIDHIVPFSKGGTNTLSNLQVLCKDHNLKKMNKIYK